MTNCHGARARVAPTNLPPGNIPKKPELTSPHFADMPDHQSHAQQAKELLRIILQQLGTWKEKSRGSKKKLHPA